MARLRELAAAATRRKAEAFKQLRCSNHPDRPVHARGLCDSCYQLTWQVKDRAAAVVRARTWQKKKRYNMTLADEVAFKKFFPATCFICRVRPASVVDHDHTPGGHVQGYICDKCNMALGIFLESPLVIERALEYRRNPPLGKDWKKTIHEHRSEG
jgi:hypothetical protein